MFPQSQFQNVQRQRGRVAALLRIAHGVVGKILDLALVPAVDVLLVMLHGTVGQGQRTGAKIGQIAAVAAEKLDAAPIAAAKVIEMHLGQQGRILRDVNRSSESISRSE